MANRPLLTYLLTVVFLLFSMISADAEGSEWLYYDEGDPVHAGSGLPYQGVRFSLPGDGVRSPLLQVAFYFSTDTASCPVKIHITDHSHSARLADPVSYYAVNGWNYLDLTKSGIWVPHNFYVILESRTCGSLMLDDNEQNSRSFKGNHLKSLATRLSHDFLIRAEVGEPAALSVIKKWDVTGSEKTTVQQKGVATQRIIRDFGEAWTLYDDASIVTDDTLYGLWKQNKQKFQISLDPEEVREHLIEGLSYELSREISDVIVTRTIFSGKIATDGAVKGTLKIFAKITLFDSDIPAKAIIERKFVGIIAESPETEAIVQ
jgi:hypothetical protein